MLYDRRYMRGRGDEQEQSGLKCLFALIVLNIAAFVVVAPSLPLKIEFCLSPWAMRDLKLWQPLTAIFMHGGWLHLLMNMFGLFMFGTIAAPRMGAGKFLSLFLFSGVAGNLVWLAVNWNSPAYLLGASGAMMGVIMASAMLSPNQEVYFIFAPFPVKLKTMAIVFVLIDLFSEFTNPPVGGSVAYLAHIGGFLGGGLFMKLSMPRQVEWDLLSSVFGAFRKKPPKGWTVQSYESYASSSQMPQRELDRILDKISAKGVNSLTEEELEALRQARERMKGGGK